MVVDELEVLSGYLLGWIEEKRKEPSDRGCPGRGSNQTPPECKSREPALCLTFSARRQ
jgi:hypothetical protein